MFILIRCHFPLLSLSYIICHSPKPMQDPTVKLVHKKCKCKKYLSMRFLWVAPLLARIYSASLLQVRVQHWEVCQEICKLKNIKSEISAKWQNKLILTHLINGDHESVAQLVDFRIEENVGISEGIFLCNSRLEPSRPEELKIVALILHRVTYECGNW